MPGNKNLKSQETYRMPNASTDIRSGNGRRLYQNLSSSQLMEIAPQRSAGHVGARSEDRNPHANCAEGAA